MKVYVFGNQDLPEDKKALEVAKKLEQEFFDIDFVFVKPNEDLPFADEKEVVLIDTVYGADDITILENKDFDKLSLPSRASAHDFDLAFQLKYLEKLGRLGNVKILAIPAEKPLDYLRVSSSFKKLVAHDMQGS